jgi:hypothetical protein
MGRALKLRQRKSESANWTGDSKGIFEYLDDLTRVPPRFAHEDS